MEQEHELEQDTPPESPDTVSLLEALSSEPGSPQSQVRSRVLNLPITRYLILDTSISVLCAP